MPTPGADNIATSIVGMSYTVEGGVDTQFKETCDFVQELAAAMDAGWTSSADTPTSMTTEFQSAFEGYHEFVFCIATGIDQETAAWADTWDGSSHSYAVTKEKIVNSIKACADPFWSNGAQAIAEAAADAFMSGFSQDSG